MNDSHYPSEIYWQNLDGREMVSIDGEHYVEAKEGDCVGSKWDISGRWLLYVRNGGLLYERVAD